jgi:hypothetical protein
VQGRLVIAGCHNHRLQFFIVGGATIGVIATIIGDSLAS